MKEEEKSIFPQKCQKIRGKTTDCMMNSEGLKQGLKAFFMFCFHTKDKTAGEFFVMGLWKG